MSERYEQIKEFLALIEAKEKIIQDLEEESKRFIDENLLNDGLAKDIPFESLNVEWKAYLTNSSFFLESKTKFEDFNKELRVKLNLLKKIEYFLDNSQEPVRLSFVTRSDDSLMGIRLHFKDIQYAIFYTKKYQFKVDFSEIKKQKEYHQDCLSHWESVLERLELNKE